MTIEMALCFVIFTLVTFAITSGILYSEIVSGTRDFWIEFWDGVPFLGKLKYLGICSLCLGFHVANAIQWAFLEFITWLHYFGFSLAAAGITWMLAAWTNKCLWERALAEQKYNLNKGK